MKPRGEEEKKKKRMTAPTVAVIGGGVAGLRAALSASSEGAKTTLIDSSKRIGLSKALFPFLLSDGWAEEDLFLPHAESDLREAGVEVRTGETVASIRREGGQVRLESSSPSSSSTPSGGGCWYDAVVVCTGAVGQPPPLRGVSKPSVFVLQGPADYLRLAGGLDALETLVVSGTVPLALKLGEILATRKGKRVHVYCGRDGLEHQFTPPVAEAIRRQVSRTENAGNLALVEGSVDSILGVGRAEAVVSEGAVRTCDAVVIIPRAVPCVPRVDCQRGPEGGLLVDASMSTSTPGVFAAGDSAEVRFKLGSIAARLYSTSVMGGEVAGANAAGGRALATPSWAVEQTYLGLEFCSAGLREEEAKAVGLDAATEVTRTSDGRVGGSVEGTRETIFSMVYDRGTHQVYGVWAAGRHARSLSSAASLIVSLGLTVDQLGHAELAYSPGSTYDTSPIALTAARIMRGERR